MTKTRILYIGIILIATFFARLAMIVKFSYGKGISDKKKNKLNYFFVILSFLTLFFFAAFTTSGKDYYNYERWFEQSATLTYSEIFQQEWGYYLFNRVINFFTSNYQIYNVIFVAVVLLLIYSTLCKYQDKIHFSWAIFIYSAVFYFPLYNVKRICLAAAIIFFGTRYLIEKKYIKYFVCIIIASTIHTSAILWLLFLIAYAAIKNKTYKEHLKLVVILSGFMAALLIYTSSYWTQLLIFERYTKYVSTYNDIGIGIIIKYGFIFFLLINYYKLLKNENSNENDGFLKISIISTCISMIFAFAGYVNQVFSRMQTYSLSTFIIFIPFLLKKMNNNSEINKWNAIIIKFILIAYIAFLFMDISLISSGIDVYTTIWGWKI